MKLLRIDHCGNVEGGKGTETSAQPKPLFWFRSDTETQIG